MTKKKKITEQKNDTLAYTFTAASSSSFERGDPQKAKIVLDNWKSYQDNRMEDTRALWADTVRLLFANGFTFHGVPDSLVAGGKAQRSGYTALVDSIDAGISTRSTDKKEDWVCVWGREYSTDAKGKKDTTGVQEIWRLKNGKVSFMSEFTTHHQ
ncbi:MAG: hypothetical protein ABI813_15605 [Bacteroidota bacterium]